MPEGETVPDSGQKVGLVLAEVFAFIVVGDLDGVAGHGHCSSLWISRRGDVSRSPESDDERRRPAAHHERPPRGPVPPVGHQEARREQDDDADQTGDDGPLAQSHDLTLLSRSSSTNPRTTDRTSRTSQRTGQLSSSISSQRRQDCVAGSSSSGGDDADGHRRGHAEPDPAVANDGAERHAELTGPEREGAQPHEPQVAHWSLPEKMPSSSSQSEK